VLHLAVAPRIGPFWSKVLMTIGINVILAVSLTIVNGFTGQFSIGHAGFMAVGGYSAGAMSYYASLAAWGTNAVEGGRLSGGALEGRSGALLTEGDWLFAGSLLVGGLVAALLGFLVGLPSLRLRGDYLAIVTLGFGEIVRVLLQQTGPVLEPPSPPVTPEAARAVSKLVSGTPPWILVGKLGGALGFTGLPKYTSVFWVSVLAIATFLVAYRLKRSSYGRAFLSIREDEIAAEAVGVNTTRYKVWAFVISAFFAGMAGGLFAHTTGVQLNPVELGFQKSFDVIIMVVLGGLGSISGAAIAAATLTVLLEALRSLEVSFFTLTAYAGVLVLGLAALFAVGRALTARGRGRPRTRGRGESWRRPALRSAGLGAGLFAVAWIGRLALPGVFGYSVMLGDYRMILYALALVLMMIARPQGLFGVREIWERAAWEWLGVGRKA